MKNTIDTNFAFAILILVASLLGFVFWLDYENEEINDLVQNCDQIVVSSAMNKKGNVVQPKTAINKWDSASSKAYVSTEILTPEILIDKIDKLSFETPTLSTEFYKQAHSSKDKKNGIYSCAIPGPSIDAIKCFEFEKTMIDDKEYLRQINLGYDYTGSPWVALTWTHFSKGALLLSYIDFDGDTISEDFFDYEGLKEIESEEERKNISYTQLDIDVDKLGAVRTHIENFLATKSTELDSMQAVSDVDLVTKYLQDRNDAEKSTDPQRLRDLSESVYFFVRYNVAKNVNTPTDTLTNLAGDENDHVKVQVKFNHSALKEVADTIDNPF